MIISHQHRYLFVEVPHTGSHSIAAELIEYYAGERILRKHANLTQFMAQASADERQYFIFGTVRNPLDTAVTDYSKYESNHRGQYTNPAMQKRNGGHLTEQHLREFAFVQGGGSFVDFMRTFRNKLYHNWFLIGSARFNHVLRFESLAQDYAVVIGRIGLPLVRELPHVNSTKKRSTHFSEFYLPEIRAQITRTYGPFMRHWGYEFPPEWGNPRIPAANILRFELIERTAGMVARFAKLDPDNAGLGRVKRLLDSIG